MKILVIHEVNYLEKIIYEYQILPEMFSMFGHDVTVVDYDENGPAAPLYPRSTSAPESTRTFREPILRVR